MRILQKKLNVKTIKNGNNQLEFTRLQQHAKSMQKNILHIFTITIFAKLKTKNVLILF